MPFTGRDGLSDDQPPVRLVVVHPSACRVGAASRSACGQEDYLKQLYSLLLWFVSGNGSRWTKLPDVSRLQ